MAVRGGSRTEWIKFFGLEGVTVFETVKFLVAKEAKETKEKAEAVHMTIHFHWLRSDLGQKINHDDTTEPWVIRFKRPTSGWIKRTTLSSDTYKPRPRYQPCGRSHQYTGLNSSVSSSAVQSSASYGPASVPELRKRSSAASRQSLTNVQEPVPVPFDDLSKT